jgi:hypothetical protein
MRLLLQRTALLLVVGGSLIASIGCARSPAVLSAAPAPVPVAVRAQADDPPSDPPKKTEPAKDAEGFRFPEDRGGQLLGKVLLPSEKTSSPPESVSTGPRPLAASPTLDQPTVPLTPSRLDVPRLPSIRKVSSPRLRPLPDEAPLSTLPTDPQPPQAQVLPAGERARVPGPDPLQPATLPLLAQPLADRASLDDPGAEFSAAAVQAATVPARSTPAPFVRQNLPDPFENRDTVRLRNTPDEHPDPQTAAPKGPGR